MKKFNIILVFALMLALVLALAACRSNEDEPNDTTTQDNGGVTPPNQPNSTTENDTTAQPTLNGIHVPQDFGGRTIRIAGWWAYLLPGTVDDEEPDPATATDYYMSRLRWDNARRIESEFNISYYEIVVPYEELMTQLTASVMAGDPVADVYLLPGYGILTAFTGDLLTPWNEVNLPSSDLLGAQTWVAPTVTHEGNIWSTIQNSGLSNGLALGVNLDIINSVGAPNPVDLFNQDRWD